MKRAILLAALLAWMKTANAFAGDFDLPAPAAPSGDVSVYASWYHMMNRKTVSAQAPYGQGSGQGYRMVPYRSIAADT